MKTITGFNPKARDMKEKWGIDDWLEWFAMRLAIIVLLLGASLQNAWPADVVVTWVTEDRAVANATSAASFVVGLGVTEVKPALSARSHTFVNVAPGSYAIWAVTVDGTGKQLAPPVTGNVVVPPAATAPIPVTIGGSVK